MGKGDQRTKRGKIFAGTFGKTRPRKRKKKIVEETKQEAKSENENKEAE
jgi:30S ribosomal protein S31